MPTSFYYYFKNEIKFKIKTSAMLWCYFASVVILALPNVLLSFFFHQLIPDNTLINTLLFLMLVFFPLNIDTFTREIQLNMLDFLIMRSAQFKTIYSARIHANAVLMTIPIFFCFSTISLSRLFFVSILSNVFIPIYLALISLFFYSWFMTAMLVLSIIELKFPYSMIRILFYFGITTFIIGSFLLIKNLIIGVSTITEILFGQEIFENVILSLLVIIVCCMGIQRLLSTITAKRIDDLEKKTGTITQVRNNTNENVHYGYYSLVEAVRSRKGSVWRKFVPCLGGVIYLIIFIWETVPLERMKSFLLVLGFFFFLTLLYVLLIIFPQSAAEKEFNMEELLLTKISSFRYLVAKVTLLLRNIFQPLLPSIIVFLALSMPSSLNINDHPIPIYLVLIVIILVIRAFYFIAILIFIWRFLPAKNLLHSTLFSILGLEIFLILFSHLLFPGSFISRTDPPPVLIAVSPILSSLILYTLITDPSTLTYFSVSIWLSLTITIVLLMASLVLIKAEIRFD